MMLSVSLWVEFWSKFVSNVVQAMWELVPLARWRFLAPADVERQFNECLAGKKVQAPSSSATRFAVRFEIVESMSAIELAAH